MAKQIFTVAGMTLIVDPYAVLATTLVDNTLEIHLDNAAPITLMRPADRQVSLRAEEALRAAQMVELTEMLGLHFIGGGRHLAVRPHRVVAATPTTIEGRGRGLGVVLQLDPGGDRLITLETTTADDPADHIAALVAKIRTGL